MSDVLIDVIPFHVICHSQPAQTIGKLSTTLDIFKYPKERGRGASGRVQAAERLGLGCHSGVKSLLHGGRIGGDGHFVAV